MKINLLYTDIEEMPLSEIIRIWEYIATIGIVGYGILWGISKILL